MPLGSGGISDPCLLFSVPAMAGRSPGVWSRRPCGFGTEAKYFGSENFNWVVLEKRRRTSKR